MKQNRTITIGHKNPDTDSIISAMITAFYSEKIFGVKSIANRAGEINNETKFVLSFLPKTTKIKIPRLLKEVKQEKVILVDTTEPSQLIDGINENNLFAIIDHHNLGGLKSMAPIYARVEPLGCACSIIYKILKEKKIKISKEAAILMIAAIISDTLFFNSPTTTDEDKKIVKELNKIAKLNLKKFSDEMFKAKSSLKGIKTGEIIEKDYKFFQMGKNRVGVGVWETVDSASIIEKKEEIFKILLNKKSRDNLEYLFFGVVDILKENISLFLLGEKEENLARQIFKKEIKNKVMFLPGIVSRKKQIVPQLKKVLS
ncbi:MAG: manganese-dependent inorganic pyrophosphatase [Patescibacteria group bacterium]|nr:manganese-dependent inorganic pyrophosphatase [Patescibacteria group bacterium]